MTFRISGAGVGLLLISTLTACAARSSAGGPRTSATETISGVVRVSKPSAKSGKQFLGVYLESAFGERWVLTYRSDDLWSAFDGQRVVLSGQRYIPDGQAILGPHFRPLAWRVEQPADSVTIIEVGSEQTLRGTFEQDSWPSGTKLASETRTRFFDTARQSYFLANEPGPLPLGKAVEVRARRVELSHFVARPGGPYLWIYDVTPR